VAAAYPGGGLQIQSLGGAGGETVGC
jgi:hypothetical protein